MEFEDLKVTVGDRVGTIEIDRGDGRNAMRPETLNEIIRAVERLERDDAVRVILLTAAGKHFSAGADFAFLETLTASTAVEIRDRVYSSFQGAARALWYCAKPTLAAINGAAVTVGCELALACDFRIVGPSARFQETWIKLGILPPLGGLFLLPRLVGLGRAAEMVLTARPVDADEAVRIGLASRRSESGDTLRAEATAFALELSAAPPLAYRSIKEGLHRGLESTMENEWATNVLAQSLLLGSADFREGLTAVKAGRAAAFLGH